MKVGGTFIAAVFMLIGIFFYAMNWAIFINNRLGKKWSSNIPPLGGLIIAAVFLFTHHRLLALLGLTDPGLWLIFYALLVNHKKNKL